MRYFLLFWILGFAISTGAQQVHLGAPPPGLIFVELNSTGSVSPTVLAGSLLPATLNFNGKIIKLKPGKNSRDQVGLWINGKSYPTADTMGRFFVQMEGVDAAVPELHIEIQNANGELFESTIILNRMFLEAPISKKLVLKEDEKKSVYSFPFEESLPLESELIVNQQRFFDKDKVTLDLSPGKRTLVAEYRLGKFKKFINIDLNVVLIEYEKSKPVLSLSKQKETSDGIVLQGITNPNAQLSINQKSFKVSDKGQFDGLYVPSNRIGVLTFKVITEDGNTEEFSKAFECRQCVIDDPAKSLDKNNSPVNSVTLNLVDRNLLAFVNKKYPGTVITSFNSPQSVEAFSLSYSHRYSHQWHWLVIIKAVGTFNGDDSDLYAIQGSNGLSLGVGGSYQRNSHYLGMLAVANNFKFQSRGFAIESDTVLEPALMLFYNWNYHLNGPWSFSPRVSVSYGQSLTIFSFDVLGVRYVF